MEGGLSSVVTTIDFAGKTSSFKWLVPQLKLPSLDKMPPKKVAAAAAPTSTQVFVVWSANGPKSVHATRESADQALAASTPNSFIDAVDFIAGSAATTNVKDEKKPAAKAKAAPKSKLVKVEEKEEIDDGGDTQDEEEAPKPVAKKTKTPAQQRAANAEKPGKPGDADLPANVRRLLADGGTVFEGKTVIVTGVPPTLGRKNTERLVEAFGAHLGKSLSRKTDYVVVGNDAGPKKYV